MQKPIAEIERERRIEAQTRVIREMAKEGEMKERIKKEIIAELKSEPEKNNKKQSDIIVLSLNKNGELYREKHCYPIKEDSDRHKIVRYFADNKLYDYYPTNSITSELELEYKSFGKIIGVINQMAKGKLKIKNKIIEGKSGSGYRINPKYKINTK